MKELSAASSTSHAPILDSCNENINLKNSLQVRQHARDALSESLQLLIRPKHHFYQKNQSNQVRRSNILYFLI